MYQIDKKFVVFFYKNPRKEDDLCVTCPQEGLYISIDKKGKRERKEHVFFLLCVLPGSAQSRREIVRGDKPIKPRATVLPPLFSSLYKHFVRDVFSSFSDCNTHLARITCRALLIECGKEKRKKRWPS